MDERTIKQALKALIGLFIITGLVIVLFELSAPILPKSEDFAEKGIYEIVSIERYERAIFKSGSETNWILYYVDDQSLNKLDFSYSEMPEIEIEDTNTPVVVVGDEMGILGTKKEVYKIRASKEWLKKNITDNVNDWEFEGARNL